MKKSFEMELVLTDTKTVFADGFQPGGLVKQIVTFDVSEAESQSPFFEFVVERAGREFLEANVRVAIREVPPESKDMNNENN